MSFFDLFQFQAFWQAIVEIFSMDNFLALLKEISEANLINIIIITFIPAILIFILIYTNRKHQQPWFLLLLACLSGLLTVSLAFIFNSYAGTVLGWARLDYTANRIYLNLDAMYGVGLVEESIKMLIVFFFIRKNKHAISPYSGVLYGALVGLSFAIFENLLSGYINNLIRCFTSVPMHMLVGMVMGYFMVNGDLTKDHSKKRTYDYLALFIPAIIHGTYNGLAINASAVGFIYPNLVFITNISFILIILGIYVYLFKLLFRVYDLNEIFYNNGEYPPKYNWYKASDILKPDEVVENFENRNFIE
jgi:RsiW-degrading membrane proteinase PrsW (M82 family)